MHRSDGKFHDTELLLHEPGERWTYGCGTRILGELIEKVSGQRLDWYLRSNVFEPLGMADTGYRVSKDNLKRLVTVHKRQRTGFKEEENGADRKRKRRW